MPNESSARILGIDPGLNVTGYAVIEAGARGPVMCEAGVVRGTDRRSLTARLNAIHRGVLEVIEQWRPAAMSLEQLYSHYQRPRTAILMGHARGVICLAAVQSEVDVHDYSATHVKKTITGNGRATKQQIQMAVMREYGLKVMPEPADVADALAIASVHWHQMQRERTAAAATRDGLRGPIAGNRRAGAESSEVPKR